MGRVNPVVGRILVVDDEAANRELLKELLESKGHTIREASSGQEALDVARTEELDVILLDVRMPGMDGFQACRELRADSKLSSVPIILVTGLTDRKARLCGISEGANDFITKPIDLTETALRVRNAVRQKQLFDLSESRYSELKKLESSRQGLIDMVVHDLKTPLSAVTGYVRLLAQTAAEKLSEQEATYLHQSAKIGSRMTEMIDSLLDVARMETDSLDLKSTNESADEIIDEAMSFLRPLTPKGVTLQAESKGDLTIFCDRNFTVRILINLTENALRHVSKTDGNINIEVEGKDDFLEFRVRDNGRGIPAEAIEKIFDKFSQVGLRTKRTFGLGLTFCKMAVEAQGGRIKVESELGQGSIFSFTLPTRVHSKSP